MPGAETIKEEQINPGIKEAFQSVEAEQSDDGVILLEEWQFIRKSVFFVSMQAVVNNYNLSSRIVCVNWLQFCRSFLQRDSTNAGTGK